MRPDLVLFWCWLYLSPYRVSAPYGVRADAALRRIGGPDAVEAVRLQIEETLVAKESPILLGIAQEDYFKLALASSGGLKVVLDAMPRVEAARLDAPPYNRPDDPLEALLLVMRSKPADERVQQAIRDLGQTTKDPTHLAFLVRLKKAATGRQETSVP